MAYQSSVPVAPEYAKALGHAIYSFSYLEWGVVWCVQELTGTFLDQSVLKMMSSQIATSYRIAVKKSEHKFSPEIYRELKQTYADFFEAVNLRKDLLHAHPFTAEGGEQMLGRNREGDRVHWTIENIEAANRFFDDASRKINGLFHQHLYQKKLYEIP